MAGAGELPGYGGVGSEVAACMTQSLVVAPGSTVDPQSDLMTASTSSLRPSRRSTPSRSE